MGGGSAAGSSSIVALLSATCSTSLRVCLSLVAHHSLQVPDEEKRRRADHVIDTGCSLQETQAQVAAIVEQLQRQPRRSVGKEADADTDTHQQ